MAEGDAPPTGGKLEDVGKVSFDSNGEPAPKVDSGAPKGDKKEEFPWIALVVAVATVTLAVGYIAGIMNDNVVRK